MQAREKRHDLIEQRAILEHQIEFIRNKSSKLRDRSNMGRRFEQRTFDTFEPRDHAKQYVMCKNYAREFETNNGESLLILGTVGTGKTHLAAAVANYVMENHFIPVKFVTAIDLFSSLKDWEDKKTGTELKTVDLLIIDDLGKEKITDWNREKLYEIINARYESYKPIVITSNCSGKQLQAQVGEAVYSRLCEMCRLIPMDGADVRKEVTR